jgi:hypothetical protein
MTDLGSKKEESYIKNFQSALSFLEGFEIKYTVISKVYLGSMCTAVLIG